MDINEYASYFENYKKGFHLIGLLCLTADRQIINGMVEVNEVGNEKAFLRDRLSEKWCIVTGGLGNNEVATMMMGAVCGDLTAQIEDEYEILAIVEYIMESPEYDDAIFYRDRDSYYYEWKAHNILYSIACIIPTQPFLENFQHADLDNQDRLIFIWDNLPSLG